MHKRLLVLTVVAMSLYSCSDSQVDTDEEKQAVRATWDAIGQAFIDKDWIRYSSFFDQSPDFQLVHPAQQNWISGFDDFQAQYEPLITAEGEWKFETTRFDANVGPAASVAWAMIEFTFALENGDPITNWELVVFTKNEGKWSVASALVASLPSS